MASPQFFLFADIAAYNDFEKALQTQLGLPATPRNDKTKRDDPNAQKTTNYSKPITHPGATDNRVIAEFDSRADTTGKTILSEKEAASQGFIPAGPVVEVRGRQLFIDGVEIPLNKR